MLDILEHRVTKPLRQPLVTPIPFSIYYPGCDNSPLSLHRPAREGNEGYGTYHEVFLHKSRTALPVLPALWSKPGAGSSALQPQPHELQPQAAEEGWD